MCGLTAMLSIASGVASFAAESAKVNAENAARAQNRVSAQEDYNRQIENEQRNYIAESRATQQKGFDAELASREAIGKANAMAASQGAAGVSVDAVFNELVGKGSRNQSRIDDEAEVNEQNYTNRSDTAYAQVQSRINANQPISGPSPLGLFVNIGSALAA